MDKAKVKRIIWAVLIGAMLYAGSVRAVEWLEPWRLTTPERFGAYVQR